MASISSMGIGSGLDLNGLLDQLTKAEQARLVPLTQQQTSFKGQITAFGILQSSLSQFSTATEALQKANDISGLKVSSSNNSFGATVDNTAVSGNYTVNVTQMAQSQSLQVKTADSTTQLGTSGTGTRTLVIEQPGLDGKPMEITLTDEQTSLEGIRDAINAQQGGVSATIIQGKDGAYLTLTSKETGTNAEMKVSVQGDDALNAVLNNDPAIGQMKESVPAKNAELTINGVAVESQSNTIKNTPTGVTLTLKSVSDKAETLSITNDVEPLKKAINDWVNAYNSLQTTFASVTKFTPSKPGEAAATDNGELAGDNTVRSIKNQLSGLIAGAQPGAISNLYGMGITLGADGKLTVDDEKLTKALNEQPANVKGFFVGDGKETGLANEMFKALDGALNKDTGLLKAATDGINQSLDKLGDTIQKTTDSINATINSYKQQFVQLDVLMTKLNSTSSYLTQQFAGMNKS